MIEMLRQFAAIGEQDIVEAESKLGGVLPTPYRHFLLTYFGGRTKDRVFDIPGIGGSDEVRYFYGLGTCDINDLLAVKDIYANRIPNGLLPIGCDDLGNQICICLSSMNYGGIFFWYHELEFTPEKAIVPLAGSFDEFIASLREDV